MSVPGDRCPRCGAPASGARCAPCGLDLADPRVVELIDLDRQLAGLQRRRATVIAELTGPPGAPGSPVVRPDLPPPPVLRPDLPPPPAAWAPTELATPAATRPPPSTVPPPRPSPHISTILLTLGVVLLVLAAIVFSAVNWERLGPGGQAAVLVAFTLAAGAGTWFAARRRLPATAEALGVVTVAMGPILSQAVRTTVGLPDLDELTWATVGTWSWWPASLVLIGAAALGFGRWVGVRSSRWLGAASAGLGAVAWVVVAPLEPLATGVLLAAVAAMLLAVRARWARSGSVTAPVWLGTGILVAVASLLWVAAAAVLAETAGERAAVAVVLAAYAALAAVAAHGAGGRGRAEVAAVAGASAALLALAAVVRALAESVPVELLGPLVGTAAVGVDLAAVVVGGRSSVDRSASRGARVASVAVVALASLPLVAGAAAVVDALAWVVARTWELEATSSVPSPSWAPWAWGIPGLAVLAALAVVELRRARDRCAAALAVVGAVALLMAPVLAGAPLWGLMGSALAVAAAASLAALVVARRLGSLPEVATVAAIVAAGWAAGSAGLTLVALLVATGLGAVIAAVASRRDGGAVGALAAAASVCGGLSAMAVALWRVGTEPAWVAGVPAIAAAVVLALLVGVLRTPHRAPQPLLEGAPPTRPAAATALDGARVAAAVAQVGVVGAWCLLQLDAGGSPPVALSVSLVVGVVCFGVGAAASDEDPARLALALGALAEAVALAWVQLAGADVGWPEAYLLPLAVAVGVAAVLAARWSAEPLDEVPSWRLEGPMLALAVVPTALLALGDPGATRQTVALAAGVVLLAAGAIAVRRAPVDIGAVVVLVVGARVLVPVAASMPWWVSLGVAGVLLVALGATFEQRKRDARALRRRYAELQ